MGVLCDIFQVFNSHKLGQGGKLGDFCDGELYKDHPLFKADPCALQIRLYYDDLEMCNALGSKNKKHKLGNNFFNSILLINMGCVFRAIFLFTW